MPNCVFVLSPAHRPQTPVHPAVARKMLTAHQAVVCTRYPFTIILTTSRPAPASVHAHRLKLDPGSKPTGLALLGRRHGGVGCRADA